MKKISNKRIRIKEREKANNEIFSKLIDVESSLNLILKNIYLQRYKLNELELEISKNENLDEKDFGEIIIFLFGRRMRLTKIVLVLNLTIKVR